MTKIKDIFKKDINRNIRGVIKVGQDEEDVKEQELEEYVVTDELKNDFIRFFDSYDRSINNITDEMGVWISGFFGSGKSHFLKILSYLLENDVVAGKKAIDYFLQDGKFDDDHLKDAINKATSVPTDVALFNIDSKADANAANESGAILTVFLKVFNEKLGYSSIPEVAEMERWLDSEGKYEEFKKAFQDLDPKNHTTWEEARSKYAILTTRIQKALVNSGVLNEVDAENYNLQTQKVSVTPESFAKLVKDYLDKKGQDHHFVFLADEVGQFIGENDQRMLNLQTIVEQLGVQCQGKAWVIVTSQQQMDQVTENFSHHERDFSKIQGRFNTLINMSSANADEVIRKRLLDKTPRATEELQDLYQQKQYTINNKINFSDAIKRQKFDTESAFVTNYPFIPYQFGLLKDVLAAVRKRGANGSHMSDGERSMLATFQSAAEDYENDDLGTLVPFSAFFIGMKEFLSHDHQVVFDKAYGDKFINPNNESFNFNIQVLAILFMVKYVDNFPATLNNIVTLLLDNVDEDVQALTAKVKDSLNILLNQNYIQRKLDTYEFLTDSEQEVNESINAIEVDDHKVVQRIGQYLLSTNSINPKFNYPKMNDQYIFEFNLYIDGAGLNRLTHELNIRIVSPLQEGNYSADNFKQTSSDGKNIIVVLKDDDRYIENYRRVEKINQYLQTPESRSDLKKQEIALRRQEETKNIEEKTNKMLIDDLVDADIYVLGDVLPKGSNFRSRLEKAEQELIDNNYRQFKYLTSPKSTDDIINLIKGKDKNFNLVKENEQAIQEIIGYITSQAYNMNNVSFSSVAQKFERIPYGYHSVDIAWMVTSAFLDGKLRLYFNNAQVSLKEAKQDPKKIEKYLLGKNNASKLTLKPVKEITPRQRKDAQNFVIDILDKRLSWDQDETSEQIAEDIQKKLNDFINYLRGLVNVKYSQEVAYPNRDLLQEGIAKLEQIAKVSENDVIFQHISKNLDNLEDWRDEVDDLGVFDFYGIPDNGLTEQQRIWNRSKDYQRRYQTAEKFIQDKELKTIADQISENLEKDNFDQSIPALKKLNTDFAKKYSDVIQALYDEINDGIKDEVKTLNSRVEEAQFPADTQKLLLDQIDGRFGRLAQSAKSYSESDDFNAYINLYSLREDIDENRQSLLKQINKTSARIAQEIEDKKNKQHSTTDKTVSRSDENNDNEDHGVTPAVVNKSTYKRTESISITKLVGQESWHITNETELNQYIEELKSKLEKELKSADILNIDFR